MLSPRIFPEGPVFLAFTMDLSLTLLKGPRIRISAGPGYQGGRIDIAFFQSDALLYKQSTTQCFLLLS
ncbi:hypothetical protein HMPREF1986_00188 [Oribacterium sp. oral taxon 078 str. F0263]|nr:hypothetical protein HMPREF1986_00188 [Oribacterium sp. oral taxon 078 str. F0263]